MSHDNAGNVSHISDRRDGVWQYQNLAYDHLDRLTRGYTSGDGTWGPYDESYSYNDIGNLVSKGGVTYTYPNPGSARPHAVSSTSAGGLFSYDLNGNRVPPGCSRRLTSGGPTYTQVWDYHNRLASVAVSGATTTFTYDGNPLRYASGARGTLVKKMAGGQVTAPANTASMKVYLFNFMNTGWVAYDDVLLEQETTTAYYFFNGQRISQRRDGVLQYLLSDHLGSNSVVLDTSGGQVGPALRYYPYGATRYPTDPSTFATEYRFTGQRAEPSLGGIYSMGARFYDPSLARWLSPDSIVL